MDTASENFVTVLFRHYSEHARTMPWRVSDHNGNYDPYHILVSELMLQQTQVERVTPKYTDFLKAFPRCEVLATAPLEQVIVHWSGLGYNRRALYLHDCAKYIAKNGFPDTLEELVSLKGIGVNTAAAVLTYAYNQRHAYIETNIRTVLIHHFFENEHAVSDSELLRCLERILNGYKGSYRDFYWAMMDYGTWLKKNGVKTHTKSSKYKKQARFEGSVRQLRGEVLRSAQVRTSVEALDMSLQDNRLPSVLKQLSTEGFIEIVEGRIQIRVN